MQNKWGCTLLGTKLVETWDIVWISLVQEMLNNIVLPVYVFMTSYCSPMLL